MNGRMMWAFWLAGALMVAGGCSSVSIPTGDGGKVEVANDGSSVNVTTADGGQGTVTVNGDQKGVSFQGTDAQGNKSSLQIGEAGSLPDGLPKEIPFPDNAVITASMAADNNGQKSYTVTFEVEQSIEDVTKLYQGYLQSNGYANTTETKMADLSMLSGDKDGYSLSVTITADAEKKGSVSGMVVYGALKQ
ncbi:hypothetical protein [Brevibacillus fluminis]|nr:hypothetical protein [Brevibacillus fluminis]